MLVDARSRACPRQSYDKLVVTDVQLLLRLFDTLGIRQDVPRFPRHIYVFHFINKVPTDTANRNLRVVLGVFYLATVRDEVDVRFVPLK